MIPYLNSKVLKRSVFKEVERLLKEKGYSPEQIRRILRWYE
jgi:predicted Ser/Thr protein kinase